MVWDDVRGVGKADEQNHRKTQQTSPVSANQGNRHGIMLHNCVIGGVSWGGKGNSSDRGERNDVTNRYS